MLPTTQLGQGAVNAGWIAFDLSVGEHQFTVDIAQQCSWRVEMEEQAGRAGEWLDVSRVTGLPMPRQRADYLPLASCPP
jgi:hypothetical protein